MTRVAVVHTVPSHFEEPAQVGDRFPIIEEPRDLGEMILFMSLANDDMTDKVVVIDLGDSFAIMTKEPDAEGLSFGAFFYEEVA